MWDIAKARYEVPKIMINGIFYPKVKFLWTKQEKERHFLTFKVKWIITNPFTLNEYECSSNYTIVKEV